MDRIQHSSLENGLNIYIETIPIRECSAYLVVNAGMIHDRIPETSHVVEHLQGSGARLYGERGRLNYVITESRTEDIRSVFYFSCMFAEELSSALKKLSLVLAQPHICWLDRERPSVRDDLKEMETAHTHIDEQISAVLFPKTAELMPTLKKRMYGLRRVSEDVCREFFSKNYTPANSFLYVGGRLSSDFDKAIAGFRNIPVRKPAKVIELPREAPLENRVEIREKWGVGYGRITIAYQVPLHPEIPLTEHIARIFFANFMGEDYGPLYRRMRDNKKLCNGINVVFNKFGKSGQLNFEVETHPRNFSRVEDEFRQALTHIAIKGIRSDHLESFRKAYYIERLHKMSHPNLERITRKVDYGVDSDELEPAISKVTPQDIANVAKMLLKSGYVVALAVPSR